MNINSVTSHINVTVQRPRVKSRCFTFEPQATLNQKPSCYCDEYVPSSLWHSHMGPDIFWKTAVTSHGPELPPEMQPDKSGWTLLCEFMKPAFSLPFINGHIKTSCIIGLYYSVLKSRLCSVCSDSCCLIFVLFCVQSQQAQETHSTISVSSCHYQDDSPELISNANGVLLTNETLRWINADPGRGISKRRGCLGPKRPISSFFQIFMVFKMPGIWEHKGLFHFGS